MKKKLLSLILTVVMAGVLAGCAEKAPAGAQSQTTGNGEMETGKMESAGDFSAAQNPDEWPTITVHRSIAPVKENRTFPNSDNIYVFTIIPRQIICRCFPKVFITIQ